MRIARVVVPVFLAGCLLGPVPHAAGQPLEGNPSRGAAVFGQCVACHSVDPGIHLTGPSLARVWGWRAGTVEGFTRYSEPLPAVVWDAATLDRWLEDPQTVVPQNLMTFTGLKDARQRADLIAYLKAVAAGPGSANSGGRQDGGARACRPQDAGPGASCEGDPPLRRRLPRDHRGRPDHPLLEFNLRFKTDSSRLGPSRDRPVLMPADMQGDRASIVFASPQEISRTIEAKCP